MMCNKIQNIALWNMLRMRGYTIKSHNNWLALYVSLYYILVALNVIELIIESIWKIIFLRVAQLFGGINIMKLAFKRVN